jgi:hypothetical protein
LSIDNLLISSLKEGTNAENAGAIELAPGLDLLPDADAPTTKAD